MREEKRKFLLAENLENFMNKKENVQQLPHFPF